MTKKFNEAVGKVLRNPEPLFDNFTQMVWKRFENKEKELGKEITNPKEVVSIALNIVEEVLRDMKPGDKLALHEELMNSRGPDTRGVSILIVRYRYDGKPDYLLRWLKSEFTSKSLMRYVPQYL